MSSSKRQKIASDSGIYLQSDNEESSCTEEGGTRCLRRKQRCKAPFAKANITQLPNEQAKTPNAYDYICFHRPLFDVDGANWRAWSDGKAERLEEEDLFDKLYKPGFDAETEAGIFKAPPSEHKNHKWVIMWDAWLKKDLLTRKAKYCDADEFGMNMYNDWMGWGMQEIVENMMIEFDKGFRQKSETRLDAMWAVMSAMGLWLNTSDHITALISNEDGERTCELIGLVGCALLTVLSAIDRAGGLKPNARFLDLPLVIAYYLEVSHDLPAYGIEGECVSWRKEAVALFKKGELDPNKALFGTANRLEQLENAPNYDKGIEETLGNIPEDESNEHEAPSDKEGETPHTKRKRDEPSKASENDPWQWNAKFEAYKQRQGSSLGGQKYDITKMSRADRAAAAYSGKDPLADIPPKDLKENLLDFD
ncbi:uncharacterized protein K460DRAFT_373832 [Cucurbitaria berberidis CBS 394.84]|uniref:Uncharacterized protein n=1 Tax=Cucurbitaria berberidis CBS 394.84 TaxID=1168544 RepID=A0A9P4GUS9_9PLEO|nr:uncharacterized protein K460DRAFT_373832 [Cucurbitaria berberidis CBS 394.84]KAF1851941.1 hypothetical protein K460DRAFT_373832 [Cucurbitaria berberidis CBS 394.84]